MKEMAVKDVARLFQRPEDLQKLPALRQEYQNRLVTNQMRLSHSIQNHVSRSLAPSPHLPGTYATQPPLPVSPLSVSIRPLPSVNSSEGRWKL